MALRLWCLIGKGPATMNDEGLADAAAASPFCYQNLTQNGLGGVLRLSALAVGTAER